MQTRPGVIVPALLGAMLSLTPAATFAQTPGATAPTARRPYRLHPSLDTAVVLSGASIWLGTEFMYREVIPLGRCPCDPAILNDLDRPTAGLSVPNVTVLSNVATGLLLTLPAVLDAFDVWRSGGSVPEWIEDTLVLGEALVVGGAVSAMFKVMYQRPRPSAYGADPEDARFSDPNTYQSFYSLSTTEIVTAAIVGSTTYALRHPRGPWRWIYLGTAGTLAAGFGLSRVLTGKHFPTDVLAATAVGSLIGLLVPLLHERPLPVAFGAAATPGAVVLTATVQTP